MRSLFIFNLLIFFISVHAQIKIPASFNNPGTYTVKKIFKNDTISSRCDTLYLVNKPLFLIYNGLYSKQKNIQSVLNESKDLFQNHINEQEKQYEKLNTEYHLTLEQFKIYQDKSNRNLDSLKLNVKAAEENIRNAQKENALLKNQIDKAVRQNNSQKYYFGLAGISIGLIIALLIK